MNDIYVNGFCATCGGYKTPDQMGLMRRCSCPIVVTKSQWYGWISYPRSSRVAWVLALAQALFMAWAWYHGQPGAAVFFAFAFGINVAIAECGGMK
jgi:hypothetical protein